MCMKFFANFVSRMKSQNEISMKIQFAYHSRTLVGKLEINVQQNFYIPESQNEDSARITWFA